MSPRKPAGFFFLNLVVIVLILGGIFNIPVSAFQTESPTATLRPETVYITVTYIEDINVRAGPNSVYYPVVGVLPIGATAPAVGRSVASEWVKIIFPEASDGSGVGWVYATLVTLSPGLLPIVEPPPTVMPAFFSTYNPAYAVSLVPQSTATRPATFTAPAPLVVTTYTNPIGEDTKVSTGTIVLILGVIGLCGLFFVSLRRNR